MQESNHEINNRKSLPLVGIVFGACAAIGYTSANGFLRALSDSADPVWVSFSKAVCTVLIFGPVVFCLLCQGKKVLPKLQTCGLLVFAGLVVQFAGNLLFQWALAEIGVALIVPITLGSMVVSSAFAGRIFLKEPISGQMMVALCFLIGSIFLLSWGASETNPSENPFNDALNLSASVRLVAACSASVVVGLAFTALGIAVRIAMKEKIPAATPMVIVGLCGVLGLGAVSFANDGSSLLIQTTTEQWLWMALAGLSNSFAFFCLTMALKSLPVVYVNAINISQVAMAAIMGVTIFVEPFTALLFAGLVVMVAGFVVMGYSSRRQDHQHKPEAVHEFEPQKLCSTDESTDRINDHKIAL